jgi:hypothetical protein
MGRNKKKDQDKIKGFPAYLTSTELAAINKSFGTLTDAVRKILLPMTTFKSK